MFTIRLGRAQPLYSKLLTSNGWITMGEVKIGDEVISCDGKPTRVIGVFPQGEREIYRVHFSDGSFTDCCDKHLWKTWTYKERSYNQRGKKLGKDWECGKGSVRTLHEIMNSLRSEHLNAKNHSIPMVEKIQFDKREIKIDPYTLGVILGDGNISKDHITISNRDEEILSYCQLHEETEFNSVKTDKCPTWTIRRKKQVGFGKNKQPNPMVLALKELNLMGTDSKTKFIPDDYKFNLLEVRISILQGLMDTDGTVDRRGTSVHFTSCSERLADDVIFITQSFGGTASKNEKVKTYTYNGEKKVGAPAYELTLALPNDINPFRLKRKAEKVLPKTKYKPVRYIIKVEYLSKKEAQCIMVDHPEHLYITDDCIVTHNS